MASLFTGFVVAAFLVWLTNFAERGPEKDPNRETTKNGQSTPDGS